MSNYLPRYTKKKDHLARREQDLLRVIKRGESQEKIIGAAEGVRAAMLRVIEAKQAMIPPRAGHEAEAAKLDAEFRRWTFLPTGEIIAQYEKQMPNRVTEKTKSCRRA